MVQFHWWRLFLVRRRRGVNSSRQLYGRWRQEGEYLRLSVGADAVSRRIVDGGDGCGVSGVPDVFFGRRRRQLGVAQAVGHIATECDLLARLQDDGADHAAEAPHVEGLPSNPQDQVRLGDWLLAAGTALEKTTTVRSGKKL